MAVLDELLVRLGVDMSEAEGEIDRGAQGIENRLTGLSAAGGVAAAGLGAAFVMGLESAMDISSVTTQLQNQLALTDEEAARAGEIAGDVYSAGFGESVGEVGEALSAVSSSMAEFGSISDKEMAQLTKDALALAKTFEFDVGMATAAAGNLIKAGLVKDGTEALDLLAATAQKVPAAMREELPEVSKEYAEFFSQLGFTGPQMFGLLAQAAQDPTFELDKLGDAVKEFSLRLADTKAAEEPLKKLGLDVAEIQRLVNEGKGTQAFDQVTTALKGVEDQTERTMLQAALFGGPGEDLGNTLLNLDASGAAAATGLDQAAGAAQSVSDTMAASPAQQFDSIMRTVSTTLGEMLLPVLSFVSDLFREHPGLLQMIIPALLALAVALGIAAVAQWAMNSALLANPITVVVLLIMALIVWIVALWQKSETFRNIVLGVWSAVQSGVEAAVDGIVAAVGWLARVPGNVAGWFGQAKDWAIEKALALVSWLQGLPGRVSRAVSGLFDAIPAAFRGAINGVIGAWNNLSFTIGGGSILGVSIPSITLSTPNIPFLAEGGIATGPTLAMIGEGSEKEAVLPLSRLEQLLNTSSPMGDKLAPQHMSVGFEPGGGDAFIDWLMETIRIRFGGDVTALGQA
ncbi:phage tail tape measure protein [Streptomyces sp. S.PB5]|uniref:phage tail tape measure protein n=1 Tax=Streptomyces sp. S.PB5 TaxID=3020844 RepID=UPI0025AEF6F6|nr:phage tail tape measure protein [Streptomyces sp. S.PB5]MDN3021533.1 phage tail tape measure protein [Streptomyces sp. S.PB5]